MTGLSVPCLHLVLGRKEPKSGTPGLLGGGEFWVRKYSA